MMALSPPVSDAQLTEEDIRLRTSARDMLFTVFGDLAGAEALTRALVAERTEQRDNAIMWLQVYTLIYSTERSVAETEVVRI